MRIPSYTINEKPATNGDCASPGTPHHHMIGTVVEFLSLGNVSWKCEKYMIPRQNGAKKSNFHRFSAAMLVLLAD